jgi:metallo-beta-lactamase class B
MTPVARAMSAGCLALGMCGATMTAQQTGTVQSHVDAAKAAAGQDHPELFATLCSPSALRPPAARGEAPTAPATGAAAPRGAAPQAATGPRPAPPHSEWYAEPKKVFDNLSFVGQTEYSAWAVATSEGIIVIDAIFDYSVEAEVVEGLKKLGLDPATIRYVVISHGHGDHHGGAKFLQDRFNARIILGAPDWELVARSAARTPAPKRDIVATDGQKLRLGDTTVTLYLTPGHTPGTISSLVPVKDGNRTHLAAAWGGTAFNFPRTAENFKTYIDSAERFRDIVTKAGADVIIANHTRFDGTPRKLPVLAARKPGQPHPYVIGNDATTRYLTVAAECAKAALLSLP